MACATTIALALVSACTGPHSRDGLTRDGGLAVGAVRAGDFTLVTLSQPLAQRVPHLRVYIGSDGRPWQANQPALNPTGDRHLAVELLRRDAQPALYLGRPCYHGGADEPPCTAEFWTSARYSATVVNAMAHALLEIIQNHEVEQLTLVGYSGGGVIALLIATRLSTREAFRSPDLRVVTVAANLDVAAWNRFHGHLPLDASLNPVVAVPSPAAFSQVHLVGLADRVVPAQTIQRYLDTHADASVWYLDDFDHSCCWVEHWPALLKRLEAAPGTPAPAPAVP